MRHLGRAALVSTALALGCSDEPTNPPPEEAVGSKEDAIPDTGGPADCFNCDPTSLKSALEQVGLGKRFLKAGDTWTVAFKYRDPVAAEKVTLELPVDESAATPPRPVYFSAGGKENVYLFDYYVSRTAKRIFGSQRRSVATIRIDALYDKPAGAEDRFGDVESGFKGLVSSHPPSPHEFGMEVELNDLLAGVGKTYFTTEYPNGRRVDSAGDSAMRAVADVFPSAIPNVDKKQTATRKLPAVGPGAGQLAPELKAVADKAAGLGLIAADWQSRDYRYFVIDLDQDPASADDEDLERVWWAPGEAWPLLVVTERGQALVVDRQEL